MVDPTPFQLAFRDELLRAAYRQHGQRKSGLRVALVAVLTAGLAVGTGLLWPSPAAADVEVTVEGNTVIVTLRDSNATAEEMVDAFAEHGLNATIARVPTGPSAVGHFVRATIDAQGTDTELPIESTNDAYATFSLNLSQVRSMVAEFGRPSRPGERYAVFSDAFATSEPLDCKGVLGSTLAKSEPILRNLSVRVEALSDAGQIAFLTLAEAVESPYSSWYVTAGTAQAPDDLTLTIRPAPGELESC
jgi:hypothetical protein